MPHLTAIAVFVLVAFVYCKPAFENKVLFQEDVLQWQGMSHNSFQYKETHGHFPLWSNSMFSGMPAYQIAMDSQSISIPNMFYNLFTLWLVKPANFFFLACLCFYFLALILRINPYIGIIGALTYAYATYNPVIVEVGHDTKMISIALMPGVVASLLLICEKKYWMGMLMTSLFTALLIGFNHIQIVYYVMIIAGGLLLGYGIPWLRQGDRRRLGRTLAVMVGAALIGILSNAVSIFTTFDSSKETVRGGSELADEKEAGSYTKDGLSEHSAFDFSMYKAEPFVMLVPDIYGGSTDLELSPSRSKAVRTMETLPSDLKAQIGEDGPRFYWGGVGEFFAGPPYVGAVIILLALIGFFILDNKHKWWILGVCIVTIAMSWGGYFQSFNSFLLKYLPMYNKFRAPSMILVVPTFLFGMMAVMTLQKIMVAADRPALWRQYKWGMAAVAGIFLILTGLYFHFSYTSEWDYALLKKAAAKGSDALGAMQRFVESLKSDRRELYEYSLIRSLVIVLLAAGCVGLYIKKKMRPVYLLAFVGTLAFVDLMNIDLKYMNHDSFKVKEDYEQHFTATEADKKIMADTANFRVFDLRDSISNALSYGAMTAYFHHSIGGYHAAKLKIYEDLIDRQLYNYPNCEPSIDMLNTKYIIKPMPGGGDTAILNPHALGPAWFVRSVQTKATPKELITSLTHFHPADTAFIFSADSSSVAYEASPDTLGTIHLIKNDNDEVSYVTQAKGQRFAVFSEVYYKRGWKAWVDDKQVPIIRTNYVLRGLSIPPGRHIVRMVFHPLSFYFGRQIQWMASILFLLMVAGTIIVTFQEKKHVLDRLRLRLTAPKVGTPAA